MKKSDFRACRKIQKKHGKSYALATLLFPKHVRQATVALYAFFRLPDEIVDNPGLTSPEDIKKELELWKEIWKEAYDGKEGWEERAAEHEFWLPVLRATAYVFHEYKIPFDLSEDFMTAMISDVTKKSYKTYGELERYMYGSAAVVGLMMTHVIGFTDKRALLYAEELGYAMQLTNFLRDIKEDYETRGRIYLPQEELQSFGITEEDIAKGNMSEMFTRFMGFQISRARALYLSADEGIPLLKREGQLAVRVASALYEAILDKIEAQGYNVFIGRARTTKWEKLTMLYTLWKMDRKSSS